jgi:hypothetical protein
MLKLYDFSCKKCAKSWEDLVDGDTSPCPKCNKPTPRDVACVGKMGAFSIKDADGQRQEMLRRSAEHTLKELKKDPEKFGPEGVRRAREGQIRSFGGFKRN